LNTKKTKELIIDFGRKEYTHNKLNIKGEEVEHVHEYKYLRSIIDSKLSWTSNTERICNKARQRLYFVRKLKKFDINSCLIRKFYECTVSSVSEFGMVAWYASLRKTLVKRIAKIDKIADTVVVRHRIG